MTVNEKMKAAADNVPNVFAAGAAATEAEVSSALDELHAYAQSLIKGVEQNERK